MNVTSALHSRVPPRQIHDCQCTEQDFECDIGYTRPIGGGLCRKVEHGVDRVSWHSVTRTDNVLLSLDVFPVRLHILTAAHCHTVFQVEGVNVSAFNNLHHRCPAGEFYYITTGYRKVHNLACPYVNSNHPHLDANPRFQETRASADCSAHA